MNNLEPNSWVDNYADYLYRYAQSRVNDSAVAEDLVQETFLSAWKARERFEGRSSEKTWFFGVNRRVCSEQRRSGARLGQLAQRLATSAEEPEQVASPAQAVGEMQSKDNLVEALKGLSPRQREVLHLVFYSGLTLEETAATLDMTVGSARTHYHRGKTQLASMLELDND